MCSRSLTSLVARGRIIPRAPTASPHPPLYYSPLTTDGLDTIRTLLESSQQTSTNLKRNSPSAAILIPLCNVGGEAGILLQVRSEHLRTHGGEVSFPGGKIDQTDTSAADTALRETREELGIFPEQIQIIGQMETWQERSLGAGVEVRPYVGFISPLNHIGTPPPSPPSTPLPALELGSLTTSRTEVAQVFHLSFKELSDSSRLRERMFRDMRPYWAVDVSDKVDAGIHKLRKAGGEPQKEVGGRLEVWGLTGWYLHLLMRTLGVW